MKLTSEAEKYHKERRDFFLKRWDEIDTEIDFNVNWMDANSRVAKELSEIFDYVPFDYTPICNDRAILELEYGTILKSMDDLGRKIIIVTTRLGPAVVYLASTDLKNSVVNWNISQRLEVSPFGEFLRELLVKRKALPTLIGAPQGFKEKGSPLLIYLNIGQWIEETFRLLMDSSLQPLNRLISYDPKRNYITKNKS